MRDYLFNKDFLYKLDQYHHKELYVKILSLTFEENPIEQIEGRVTGGSINIDGTSSMRRSCSITLVAQDVNINDFYWGLNTKFRFEIGVKNDIDPTYPEIIWFPQGTYIITNFSTSLTANNYTINISGKDKMCLLNGEVGGSLPSSIDFGTIDDYNYFFSETYVDRDSYRSNTYYSTQHMATTGGSKVYKLVNDEYVKVESEGVYCIVNNTPEDYQLYNDKYCADIVLYNKDYTLTKTELAIKDIIREAVHVYGSEPYHNIVIEDLDEKGLELMEYRGDAPMYVLYDITKGEYINISFNADTPCIDDSNNATITIDDASIKNPMVEGFGDEAICVRFPGDKLTSIYNVGKLESGDAAGYRITDLTYAGDLIASPNEPLTSMLDKIVNMLGDFEYFYDLEGRFIFRKQKTYINTSWSTIKTDGYDRYVEPAAISFPVVYSFEDNNLITSFNNSPNLLNLRNDYSVWGKRKGVTGKEIPIHARYAIDKKPFYYKTILGEVYSTKTQQELAELYDNAPVAAHTVDWREIIYRMAIDYYQYNNDIDDTSEISEKIELPYPDYTQDDFLACIQENNLLTKDGVITSLCPSGYTGYERYYIDLQGFWRDLYDPDIEPEYIYDGGYYESYNEYKENSAIYEKKTRYVEPYIIGLKNNHLLPTRYKDQIISNISSGLDTALQRRLDTLLEDYIANPGNEVINNLAVIKRNQWIALWEDYYLNGSMSEEEYVSRRDSILNMENANIETNVRGMSAYDYELQKTNLILEANLEKNKLLKELEEHFSDEYYYWNKDVLDYPEKLLFWIDFLDEAGELEQFSIPVIGDRPKVVNDNDVRAIYFREIPNLIYQDASTSSLEKSYAFKTGYKYINIPKNYDNLFHISAMGKSAKNVIDNLLYNNSYCIENVTINTIPVYYLEPNVRVYIHDERSKINGEYIVSKISLPLAYNGQMSITAVKTTNRLY